MDTPHEDQVEIAGVGTITAIVYRAQTEITEGALVLAHGAGANQRSPFMVAFAKGLACLGIDVVTFNFPYAERRARLPDRRPVLEQTYRAVIQAARQQLNSATNALFVGGKSMGGRIATHIAATDHSQEIRGIVLLGYPLHPPGRPQQRRDAHLPAVGRPMLFVQGSRDPLGTAGELRPILEGLQPPCALFLVEGGDHSLKVPRAAPGGQAAVYTDVQRAIVAWLRSVIAGDLQA